MTTAHCSQGWHQLVVCWDVEAGPVWDTGDRACLLRDANLILTFFQRYFVTFANTAFNTQYKAWLTMGVHPQLAVACYAILIYVCSSEGRYRALKQCDQRWIFLLLFWVKGTALSTLREFRIPRLLSVGVPCPWAWAYFELRMGMPWVGRGHALCWAWAYLELSVGMHCKLILSWAWAYLELSVGMP